MITSSIPSPFTSPAELTELPEVSKALMPLSTKPSLPSPPLAEEIFHHPDIFLAWGKVKITIWTHKIDGLNEADFIFAAKADALV